MRPRVAYVVKRYPRFSETFIVNEILAHEAAGLPVEIISLYPPADTHFQDGIARVRAPVTYLTAEGLRPPEFWACLQRAAESYPGLWEQLAAARGSEAREVYQAAALARLARERQIDLFHAHFASTAAEVARLAARFTGLPFSFTAHAKDIFHESVNAARLRRRLAEAAGVVTVSDFNLEHLRRRFGPDAARVVRVYNGLDLDSFPHTDPADRPRRILGVGRLIEKKGFEYLLEACAELARRAVDFECLILGTGEQEQALHARRDALGLGNRVRFLGARPQPEVIRHLRESAVFAAPCVVGADGNADGLPTVLLEAMAIGTPCVSTPVTGIPEAIEDGRTGLLVAERDVGALASALEALLTNPQLRTRLSTLARRRVEADFDVHPNTARLRTFFSGLNGSPLTAPETRPSSVGATPS